MGKSERRLKLEASLAENPGDTFLRYGLAMQCLQEGDLAEGRQRLRDLIADHPEDSIAAYQQLAQSLLDHGEIEEARAILEVGIVKARLKGDAHAASEMEGLLIQC
ncbi:hypothetical protein Isop_0942 [Isosphaera pallida ATCC 43644]|jgi:thioredoxin-like negative regulator of GroEL|uniref:Tetratricopeptide repeat protein n=1 Tax=Isosphaera pallida (strain ATCC 43644 / DSM 9630 / IS1B) TaxID=575540 RepID=E8R3G4_ISOPI|nr:tetratricopeptide repeat protein [Isosphaera pallida]ADV61531.1 hypothetical protein Isop_0942 [Isosphaera pallida ATCC 43644]